MPLPPDAGKFVTWVDEGVGFVEGEAGGATSLVIDDADAIVVDAGMPEAAARALAPHVGLVLLTTAQPAHARNAHLFERVWAPRAEARALRDADGFAEVMGVPRSDRALLNGWLREHAFAPARVDKAYTPGGLLVTPKMEWRLLAAPGPSPGLAVLFEPRRRILFASELGPAPGAPTYGWPTSDLDELENTLKRLGDVDCELLLSSHAAPRRRGAKQGFRDLAAAIRQRDAAVYDALETPRSIAEIVDLARIQGEVVGKDPMARYFERVMIEKHLSRLLSRGLAFARQDGRYEQA